jgi:hypothetical protein
MMSRTLLRFAPAIGLVLAIGMAAHGADDRTGERIYAESCASCHGTQGEGTPQDYPHPLVGERSVGQLAKLIQKTMPADDPGSLDAEASGKVAAFVHETFYSPMAQARRQPPRIELSRLTVRQYRNVLADLLRPPGDGVTLDGEAGLTAQYFKGRRLRGDNRVIERVDPEVKFDFGTASPDPANDQIEPHEFSIRWEGSLVAPDTGEYELIVRTEHAARLYLNDNRTPLIDAWVKSGNETEYRATIPLLGGRPYPLRLEFSKAKQGVDDSKEQKEKPPSLPATIALLWKRPGLAEEVVASRHLRTGSAAPIFVAATPFPPDDRSMGYERGTSISKAWDQATTDAAIAFTAHVMGRVDQLADTTEDASDRAEKLKAFVTRLAERAFRRPLNDELRGLYVDRIFAEAPNPDQATRRAVLLILKSPRLLYRELGQGTSDPFEVASRLAFTLWDSLPDQALLDAAAKGELSTPEQVAAQADRMVADLRLRSKLREFFLRWLKLDPVPELSKDPEAIPGFDKLLATDLHTSLEMMLDDVLGSDDADFRRLLLADEIPLNGRLAAFYGAELPAEAPFQTLKLQPEERAGVLTHPYVTANLAYTAASSPIHRGVFLSRSVLGRSLRPPPEAAAPLAPDLHPDLTTRERVVLQTSPETCMGCHGLINPLGFTLEKFDAAGRFRAEERGKPIDATGTYHTMEGAEVEFAGARALGEYLAASDEVHRAIVTQLFHHMVKQPIRAFGPTRASELTSRFVADGCNLRRLAAAIAATAALPPRDPAGLTAAASGSDVVCEAPE